MRVVVVSGIWPPDSGGPAIHAPALSRFLAARGHDVQVVTTAAAAPATETFRVRWVSRRLPVGARHAVAAAEVARAARSADVVYATSMIRRAASGAAVTRCPLVVKLVADEAYERARRTGSFTGSLEEFQRVPGDARVRALRTSRTSAVARAAHVFTPSAYLREIAVGWGLDERRVSVIPNPAPPLPDLPPREELRAALGMDGPLIGFAGRLTPQKGLDVALRALAGVPRATLVLQGEGPERGRLETLSRELGVADRVRFLGPGGRDDVLRVFRAADVAVLSSSWENFPHTVVEALAVGTPVVATAVGGVPEIVEDGVNGLLVAPGDEHALGSALERVLGDDALRSRLAAAAAPSVAALEEGVVLARVEAMLERVRRR